MKEIKLALVNTVPHEFSSDVMSWKKRLITGPAIKWNELRDKINEQYKAYISCDNPEDGRGYQFYVTIFIVIIVVAYIGFVIIAWK